MHGSKARSLRATSAFALALTMALHGCGKSDYERAKERYEFLKAHRATKAELCEEGKKVVSAAADERHPDYELIAVTHNGDCLDAQLERL